MFYVLKHHFYLTVADSYKHFVTLSYKLVTKAVTVGHRWSQTSCLGSKLVTVQLEIAAAAGGKAADAELTLVSRDVLLLVPT